MINLDVKEGDFVKRGDVFGAVETDKAAVDLEAERDGYVLKVLAQPKQKVKVGAVILWLGDAPDAVVPEIEAAAVGLDDAPTARPTAKARALLEQLGIEESRIKARGDRLTVADIEAWRAAQGHSPPVPISASAVTAEATPQVAGEFQDLSAEANGMLQTVLWHRDRAAAAYLDLEYDPKPWEDYAAGYARQHKLMLSPLLPLLAFRLVALAREHPKINATVVEGRRYQYQPINLGFTVQAGSTLYLVVIRDAERMDAAQFIDALGEAQRRALGHKLRAEEVAGATVAISSMARWNVSRHVPILPPQTSLIVAHAAARETGRAVLGASYDHRLLSGFDVVQVLQALARPPA